LGGALPAAGTAVGTISNGVSGTAAPQNANLSLSSGQILDIHSIAYGITAIKRHQTTITCLGSTGEAEKAARSTESL
jgi:hypothetical protein